MKNEFKAFTTSPIEGSDIGFFVDPNGKNNRSRTGNTTDPDKAKVRNRKKAKAARNARKAQR